MDRETKKSVLQIVAFGIILYCAILHLNVVWGVLRNIVSLFLPFILGGCIAFVLNVPMKQIEKRLFLKK